MDPSYLGQPIQPPTANKPTGLVTKRSLLLIISGAFAVIAGAFMLFASGDRSGPLQQRLSARQATTLAIIDDGKKNLTDDELQKLNSELSIVLLSDNNKLTAALAAAGTKKADKATTAAEADAATFEKLKTAKLNAQYDSTYQTVLSQKLESLMALSQELHGKTKKKQLKAVLAEEYTHLATYQKALEELNQP